MKKRVSIWPWLGAAAGVAVLLVALSVFAISHPRSSGDVTSNNPKDTSGDQSDRIACPAIAAVGRYIDYDEKLVGQKCPGYYKTILFFHAPWCPECRAFDQAIKSGNVPDGVQILKVDYDSSQNLRKKYGVTIQSTFVSVDGTSGDMVAKWTGYGKDKSISAIIENTQ